MNARGERTRWTILGVAAAVLGAACAVSSNTSDAGSVPSIASTGTIVPPSAAPSFTSTFESPLYGYTIGLEADWTVQPASILADDPSSTESTGTDVITITGTDTTIQTVASDLGGQAFDSWLVDYQATVTANVPSGCDGGDPSTWPPITVGDHQGVWEQKCNAAVAFVEDAGRVYQFAWENSTFTDAEHLSQADFKTVLGTVTFRTG